MGTSTKKDRQAAVEADEDFRLDDALTFCADEELAQMAEEHAQADVSSSAYEGIPLDKEKLKAGLLAAYKQIRAERAAKQPTSPPALL